MRCQKNLWTVAALALLLSAASLHADVVAAVDVSGSSNVLETDPFISPADSSTKAWSSWNAQSSLTWTDGTVSMALGGGITSTGNRDPGTENQGTYEDLYRDFVIANTTALTISGLDANTDYGVVVYSYEPATARSTRWDPTVPDEDAVTISGALSNPAESLTPANASATFTLTSDATGGLAFSLMNVSGGARFNGIAIYDTIPEPAAMTVLAAGGLTLIRRRRR